MAEVVVYTLTEGDYGHTTSGNLWEIVPYSGRNVRRPVVESADVSLFVWRADGTVALEAVACDFTPGVRADTPADDTPAVWSHTWTSGELTFPGIQGRSELGTLRLQLATDSGLRLAQAAVVRLVKG